MKLWKVAVLAFLAMCAEDLLSTSMVIAEARLNAPIAGMFDVAGWLLGLACMGLAIDSILKSGWRSRRSMVIIAAVSLANFAGTFAGVAIGAHLS